MPGSKLLPLHLKHVVIAPLVMRSSDVQPVSPPTVCARTRQCRACSTRANSSTAARKPVVLHQRSRYSPCLLGQVVPMLHACRRRHRETRDVQEVRQRARASGSRRHVAARALS